LKLGSVFIASGTASPDSAVLSLLDCSDCWKILAYTKKIRSPNYTIRLHVF
jgi:hypothetical protein